MPEYPTGSAYRSGSRGYSSITGQPLANQGFQQELSGVVVLPDVDYPPWEGPTNWPETGLIPDTVRDALSLGGLSDAAGGTDPPQQYDYGGFGGWEYVQNLGKYQGQWPPWGAYDYEFQRPAPWQQFDEPDVYEPHFPTGSPYSAGQVLPFPDVPYTWGPPPPPPVSPVWAYGLDPANDNIAKSTFGWLARDLLRYFALFFRQFDWLAELEQLVHGKAFQVPTGWDDVCNFGSTGDFTSRHAAMSAPPCTSGVRSGFYGIGVQSDASQVFGWYRQSEFSNGQFYGEHRQTFRRLNPDAPWTDPYSDEVWWPEPVDTDEHAPIPYWTDPNIKPAIQPARETHDQPVPYEVIPNRETNPYRAPEYQYQRGYEADASPPAKWFESTGPRTITVPGSTPYWFPVVTPGGAPGWFPAFSPGETPAEEPGVDRPGRVAPPGVPIFTPDRAQPGSPFVPVINPPLPGFVPPVVPVVPSVPEVPGVGAVIDITIYPDGGARAAWEPVAPPAPGSRPRYYDPRKNPKKQIVAIQGFGRLAINAGTEVVDMIEALWKAVPQRERSKRPGKKSPSSGVRLKPVERPSVYVMGTDIYKYLGKVGVDGAEKYAGDALRELMNNEVQDYAYGALGRTSAKASRRLGLSTGLQAGPTF